MYKLKANGKEKVVEIEYFDRPVFIPDFEERFRDYVLIITKRNLGKKIEERYKDIASLIQTEEMQKMIDYYKDKVKRIAVRYKENGIVRYVDNGEIGVYANVMKF